MSRVGTRSVAAESRQRASDDGNVVRRLVEAVAPRKWFYKTVTTAVFAPLAGFGQSRRTRRTEDESIRSGTACRPPVAPRTSVHGSRSSRAMVVG
jgi:hypothetical protein